MKIEFDPNNYTPTGVISFVTWENRELQDALRRAFHESPREELATIVIERAGIKAIFEPRNS